MSKKKKSQYANVVNHPRYGYKPNFTNDRFSLVDILDSHWSYKKNEVILGTCIEANLEKQNHGTFPRKLYVDLIRDCIQCDRKFIFYAEEQKYWYETLGFYTDCDCKKCIDCRKKEQEFKLLIKRYEYLLKKNHSDEEQVEFKNIAYELYQVGYIKNIQKLP